MDQFILSLDQGTTSSRAIVFNKAGQIISSAQKEFAQIFPKPGWVEHNANEIWESQLEVARLAIEKAKISATQIKAIGITNQRETTVLWDRTTGKPVYNAIVWQCRRSTEICKELEQKGHSKTFRTKTGLLLDPYFSGTKLKWLMDNVEGLSEKCKKGDICFGTIDSWLLYKLTGNHLTDPSNASRTLLYNINEGKWDDELCEILNIPTSILPEVKPSSGYFGDTFKQHFGHEIRVCGIAGDQQAALFGQACFEHGDAKNTYGTGCFMLVNTGKKPIISSNKLLTTVAWDIGDGLEYALEGSVFIGGAVVKWLRDELGLIKEAEETEKIAQSVDDTGGVYLISAFVGLGAPYWDPDARGTIVGLTRGSNRAHIIRAALESIAYQSKDLCDAVEVDLGYKINSLKVDGGASINNFLMQFQADVLGVPIIQSKIAETTALGAAYLAGLSCGYWKTKEEIVQNWNMNNKFEPQLDKYERETQTTKWKKAVETARQFKV